MNCPTQYNHIPCRKVLYMKTQKQRQISAKNRKAAYNSPGLLVLLLTGMAVIHGLVLTGVISPEYIWDQTAMDMRAVALAGTFALMILGTLIWAVRFKIIPALRSGRLDSGLVILSYVIVAYFALELTGCIFGETTGYRIFGGILYSFGLYVSVRSAILISWCKNRQSTRRS